MYKYKITNIFSIITMCLIILINGSTLAHNPDIEQLDKQEIEEEEQGDISENPENLVAWLNNNIKYYFSGSFERMQQFSNDFYKSGVTIIHNANNIPNNIKSNTEAFIKQAASSKATQNILSLFEAKNPAAISSTKENINITKYSGNDFIKIMVAPRVNVSKNTMHDAINSKNINLKLNALYMSNEALTQ